MPLTQFDELEVTGAITPGSISSAKIQKTATARTATADGTGTGAIADGTSFVTVTSGNADHIITLPDAAIGTEITLQNAGTGYELRSHDPATVGINGGTGADAESAIGASTTVIARRVNATNWVCTSLAAAGTVSATQVAA